MSVVFQEKDVVQSLCRNRYYFFLKQFWEEAVQDPFIENWHIKLICDELQYLVDWFLEGNKPNHDSKFDEKPYDLIINQMPGTTKSVVCSVALLPWIWTRFPQMVNILSSYNERLSIKQSRLARKIVKSDKYKYYFPDVVISDDQDAKGNFANVFGGERISCGCQSITGQHAHMITVDDPIEPEGSRSVTEIIATNTFLRDTLLQRKKMPARSFMILVMQRLHMEDPTGMFLEMAQQGSMKIRHICLPGELTNDIQPKSWAKFYKNGLFDPVRFPKSVLIEKEKALLDYGYAGQILQRPVPLGGGMFKTDNLKKIKEKDLPERRLFVKLVRFWDKAATQGAGCFTVGALLGKDRDQNFYILDIIRDQWDTSTRERMILKAANEDRAKWGDVLIGLEQEPGSGGKDSARWTTRQLAGFRVVSIHPTGSKESRAEPFSSQVNAGNVYMLENISWNRTYVSELGMFPNSMYKDQVDASSGAFNLLTVKQKRVGGW